MVLIDSPSAHRRLSSSFRHLQQPPMESSCRTLPLAARLDAAIDAGAVSVISLNETQRLRFVRDCPEMEPGLQDCGVDFVRASRQLVEATLGARQLELLRWFLGVGGRPAGFHGRMPSAILFRGLGGQATPDCPTPNIPPTLPFGSKHGPAGKIAAKRDCISEAWVMGIRQLRRAAHTDAKSGELEAEDKAEVWPGGKRWRLPQNLVPVPGREEVLGNEGSAEHLGWHCDGAFDRDGLQEDHLGDL
eukprot:COSAG02_NODE_8020_length_2744_cov_1.458223_3_plen_246_part_00